MIAIIGGSGFIGTCLSRLLVSNNINFVILDKNPSNEFPLKWRFCDVTKKDTLYSTLQGVDTIINLSAEHKDNVSPISLYYDVNVDGAKNICEAAKSNNINNIIFTSSVAVYGFVDKETDENGAFNPFNHYGKSKLQAEQVFNAWFAESEDKKLIIVRPTVVFGERNRGNVYNLFKQIASGNFLMIGNGNNQKSMAYVENVASFLFFLTQFPSGKKIFNYVDKPDYTMNQLSNIITNFLGKKSNNIRIPFFIGVLGGYGFDLLSKVINKEFSISSIRIKKFCSRTQFTSRFIEESGFTAPFSLAKGIENTVKAEFKKY